MRHATRNRLILLGTQLACVACVAAICGVLIAAEGGGRRAWLLTIPAATFFAWIGWTTFRDHRVLTRLERDLTSAGVEVPDEEPIPIRWAENRESLVAGLLALALIALVFLAKWAGWLRQIGLESMG